MENDELVMNAERRKKMRNWFNGALLPSLADTGVVRMVGTILHSDSLLESLMPNPSDKYTVSVGGLKEYTTKKGMWKTVKYRAHTADFQQLLWPEKKKAADFRVLYEEAVKNGMTDSYSREYLNYPIDEAVSFFKRGDFLSTTPDDKQKKLHYYITADLAISEEESADFSVFIVAGVDEDKRIHVKSVIRERLDGKEIVDTLIQLQQMYDPLAVGIEDMQVSKAIGPFLNEEMIKQNTFITLVQLKHGGKDKVTRARSIQARMRAHGVKFDTEEDWFPSFENECLTFPRGKHDDQVDAFAYLGMMLQMLVEAPTLQEQVDEDYEREMETSNFNNQGRSAITGY